MWVGAPKERPLWNKEVFMIKLVVSDMDGTLLDKEEKIPAENLEAIKRIRDMGITFTVATGRSEQMMKHYANQLDLKDPFIMCNGALIGHPEIEDNYFNSHLSKEQVKKIIEVANSYNTDFFIFTKHALYTDENPRKDLIIERSKDYNLEHVPTLKFIKEFDYDLPVYKLLLIERKKEVYEKLYKIIGDDKTLNVCTSQSGFVDINPMGNTKATALEKLMDYYGVTKDEVVCFGDQDNDMEMLELIPNSVCMENGSLAAKEAANYITKKNTEAGVAAWLNEHIKK